MNDKLNAVFICKKRTDEYGSYGLYNSAKFVSNYIIRDLHQASSVEQAIDANCIDKIVTDKNATHVIIEALWVTPEKLEEILSLKRHKGRKWIVRIHSKVSFIAHEGLAFDYISKYAKLSNKFKNLYIAPNNEEFTDDLISLYRGNFVYLPNIYCKEKFNQAKKCKVCEKTSINIGCFGAIRPMKNHLIQAIAAIEFANIIDKKLFFHINIRAEQKGEQIYKNLEKLFNTTVDINGHKKHTLVTHNWLSHNDFLNLVSSMDIGLQVSFNESFNIVASDFITADIPIVISPEIKTILPIFRADPSSSDSIKDALLFTYNTKFLKLHKLNNLTLLYHNTNAKEEWNNFLILNELN